MPYGPQDPTLLEQTLEKQWLNGEISLNKARALAAENRALIEAEHSRIQQQKSNASNNNDFQRQQFEAESQRLRDIADRPKQLSGEEKAAQEKRISDAQAEEKLNKVASENQKAAERSRAQFSYVDRQRPSSGTSSYPTGSSNPRSSGNGYNGPTGNAPTGGIVTVPKSERRNPVPDSGRRTFIPTNGGTAVVGADGVTAWKQKTPPNPSDWKWSNGSTSAAQASRGDMPKNAPSGTPSRPAPFSPNRLPSMGGGAGANALGTIAGVIGGIILSPEFAKDPGKALRGILPEWAGGPKWQNPLLPDPFKARKKGDPEPDPNDPFGDPNRPKPEPLNPFRPDYPPGTVGIWRYAQIRPTDQSFHNLRGSVSMKFRKIDFMEIFEVWQYSEDGSNWGNLYSSHKGASHGVSILGFTPDDKSLIPKPDNSPENLPDPTQLAPSESSPGTAPAPGMNPAPSPAPFGSLIPGLLPLIGSIPSPGGDRLGRPELKPENEIKPKSGDEAGIGRLPGFFPQGGDSSQGGSSPQGGSNPVGAPGSSTVNRYEPASAGSPAPKGGINPGSDPKTDPRERDKTIFDPSGKGGTMPAPDPKPVPVPVPTPTVPGLCRFEKCDLPKPQKIKIKVFKGCDRKSDGSPDYFRELELTVTSGDGAAWKKTLDSQADQLAQKCEIEPCEVAIPESWAVRIGTDRPQLVIVFTEIYSSGKLGRSRWSLTVPHYNRGEKAPISAPSYRRGSWVGRLALNDGSSLNVNAASSTECKRAINKLKILIPNSFRINAQGKAVKPRISENPDLEFKEVNVVPVFAKFFATGQKTLTPTWSKSLRK